MSDNKEMFRVLREYLRHAPSALEAVEAVATANGTLPPESLREAALKRRIQRLELVVFKLIDILEMVSEPIDAYLDAQIQRIADGTFFGDKKEAK